MFLKMPKRVVRVRGKEEQAGTGNKRVKSLLSAVKNHLKEPANKYNTFGGSRIRNER